LLEQLVSAVEANYVDGKPLHCARPEDSAFYILSHTQHKDMDPQALGNIANKRHIVITDVPGESMRFDAKGLQSLRKLATLIEMQGKLEHSLRDGVG